MFSFISGVLFTLASDRSETTEWRVILCIGAIAFAVAELLAYQSRERRHAVELAKLAEQIPVRR